MAVHIAGLLSCLFGFLVSVDHSNTAAAGWTVVAAIWVLNSWVRQ